MPLLDSILDAVGRSVDQLRGRRAQLERAVDLAGASPSFATALRRREVAVIAEIKRRSPSLGVINRALDPATLAGLYQVGGAAAISVLTNAEFFDGSIDDLDVVGSVVALPVLRKDFIIDPLQLLEARAAGAAAALLIVRILEPAQLGSLLRFARTIGLDALVEVHRADELQVALDQGATIVGINARDLDTLEIDTPAARTLLSTVPATVIAVAESGMSTPDDVAMAASAGADAVLIGSALAGAADPVAALLTLTTVARRAR